MTQPVILYRRGTWRGPGSFWSPSHDVARRYGRGALMTCVPAGAALTVRSDEDLTDALIAFGIPDAETRVLDADWLEPDVFATLRQHGITWIVRPIDPSVSAAVEWIYVGTTEP